MAPTPPAAPASIKSRRSVGGNFKSPPSSEPKPAPICAIGPSWPAEPPVPMVMIEATDLIHGTRARIFPPPRWNARIMASVPCPSASGARLKTNRPEISPPTAGTSTTSHGG